MKNRLFSILITTLFILSCSNKKNSDIKVGALIVLVDEWKKSPINKKQNVLLAYKDQNEQLVIERVELRNFSKPASIGDSVDIVIGSEVTPKKIKQFTCLDYKPYQYKGNSFEKHLSVLFECSVMIVSSMDSTGNDPLYKFFKYNIINENHINVLSLEDATSVFEISGSLGSDTLKIIDSSLFFTYYTVF